MIDSSNQVVFPVWLELSNAQRQSARIATDDDTARTYSRNEAEYCASALRCPAASLPSSICSAWRFPVTMNSEPAAATIRNHVEIGTSTAAPPATARSTKPAATAARSITASCFSQAL